MNDTPYSVWVGWEPRQAAAFAVCRASIKRHLSAPIPIYGVSLEDVRSRGFYYRPTEVRDGGLWDVISDAPCSTEFAISRFLTLHLAKEGRKEGEKAGWALFMDCDMLVRENLVRLFDTLDTKYAVYCVKHKHQPPPGTKMDERAQVQYARKNWTSLMAINADHPAHNKLTLEMINTIPGRDLHRFCWLEDEHIGELSPEWNWLVGYNEPKVVHFTEGGPWLREYENVDFADEWREELISWVTGNRAG